MAIMKQQRAEQLRAHIGKPGGRDRIIAEYKTAVGMPERELPRAGLMVSEMIDAILDAEYAMRKPDTAGFRSRAMASVL